MRPPDPHQYHQVALTTQRVAPTLIAYHSVTGVDTGWKRVGGVETREMAILVFVRKKGEFPPEEEIPSKIGFWKTDIIEATFVPLATAEAAVDTGRYDPLVGGCSVSPARIAGGYGTLGVEVLKGSQRMLLSNWHVLCWNNSWDQPGVDRRICQPAVCFDRNIGANAVGNVTTGILGEISRWGWNWYVDCALADLSGGRAASANILRIGAIRGTAEPVLGELVRKTGATTSHTYGACASTSMTAKVNYPTIGEVTFYYQYRFDPPDPSMPIFSDGGDSGSVIVDTEWKAVGLLFAGSEPASYAIANPAYMITGALGISFNVNDAEPEPAQEAR